jgi:hypothetical protein
MSHRTHEAPDDSILFLRAGIALFAAVLLLVLAGCSLTKALYHDTPDPRVSLACELADCRANAPPEMDARAHRVPDAEAAATLLAADTKNPCAALCDHLGELRPDPPRQVWVAPAGCYATCALIAGHPLVSPGERADFAPGGDFNDGHGPGFNLLGLDADDDAAQALAAGVPPR